MAKRFKVGDKVWLAMRNADGEFVIFLDVIKEIRRNSSYRRLIYVTESWVNVPNVRYFKRTEDELKQAIIIAELTGKSDYAH